MARPAEQDQSFSAIIDVRSPAEYAIDHIPGAISMPVLSDKQRELVGILYSKDEFAARRTGASLVASNIAEIFSDELANKPPDWRPLVYCWRGGQRSSALVEVMRRVGWQAQALEGGYKAFRHRVIETLACLPQKLSWQIISGPTGCGKSLLLAEIQKLGGQVLDLEALANHRGSVFGNMAAQPTQRAFETAIYSCLTGLAADKPVYIESESSRLGKLQVPPQIIAACSTCPRIWIDATDAQRVAVTVASYSKFRDPDSFGQILAMLQRHAQPSLLARWKMLHADQQFDQLAASMLTEYYDPKYAHAMARYKLNPSTTLAVDPTDAADISRAAQHIIAASKNPNQI